MASPVEEVICKAMTTVSAVLVCHQQVELLVVEFADFDAALAMLADGVARGEAGLLNEDELDRLAMEIPDMRTRLGIRCGTLCTPFRMSCVSDRCHTAGLLLSEDGLVCPAMTCSTCACARAVGVAVFLHTGGMHWRAYRYQAVCSLLSNDELAELAEDIHDICTRLGIQCMTRKQHVAGVLSSMTRIMLHVLTS